MTARPFRYMPISCVAVCSIYLHVEDIHILRILTLDIDNDELLVRKARNGNTDAFEALLRKYEVKVFRIAYRILVNREDASDATQETFLRVWRAISDFRGDSKFSTWIYRVANNICLDHIRKQDVNAFSLDDDESSAYTISDIPSDMNIETEVQTGEFRALVWNAIEQLPAAHRAVIDMREIQGLSYGEIAELLEISEGTVKSRINRARHALRGIIIKKRELKEYLDV